MYCVNCTNNLQQCCQTAATMTISKRKFGSNVRSTQTHSHMGLPWINLDLIIKVQYTFLTYRKSFHFILSISIGKFGYKYRTPKNAKVYDLQTSIAIYAYITIHKFRIKMYYWCMRHPLVYLYWKVVIIYKLHIIIQWVYLVINILSLGLKCMSK